MAENPNRPEGFPPDSAEVPPGSSLWYEGAYDPDNNGPPVDPSTGVDPDKSNPNSPNYNPHYDPHVSNPEIPDPGVGVYPDDYVVDGDGSYVPQDTEPPISPEQVIKNTGYVVYDITIFVNGVATSGFMANDLGQAKETLKVYLIGKYGLSKDFVQVRTRDLIKETWVDISGGTPPAGWDGMCTFELRAMCGNGDKL